MGKSSLPPTRNVSTKRICRVSPRSPPIQTQGWRQETPVSSSSEVGVGPSTPSSVCVRCAGVPTVLPLLVSDVSEAWLRRSNHRRVEGTSFAHRQVNNPRIPTHFTRSSNGNCRPKLSKSLITDTSKVEWKTAADLRIKFGVTLRTSTVRGSPTPLIASV